MSIGVTIRGIRQHPLARHHFWRSLWNVIRWQIQSRARTRHVVRFVDDTRLVASRRMTGLTGNIYFGLHEFESMAFALHLLRKNDLFVDVGANAGSYSILAAGVKASRVIAVEPDEQARASLTANIVENRIESLVSVVPKLVGSIEGEMRFSFGLDTTNHVLEADEIERGVTGRSCAVTTLDKMLDGQLPTLIKIDVEGQELHALEGCTVTLSHPGLLAIIAELSDTSFQPFSRRLSNAGFTAIRYDALNRRILPVDQATSGNTLFVRESAVVSDRLLEAPRLRIHPLSCLV